MNVKGYCGEGSEESEEHCRKSFCHLKEYLCRPRPNVGRNMNIKGASDEVSDGNEEHIIGNWRKGHPFPKVREKLNELCPTFGWKAVTVSDKPG